MSQTELEAAKVDPRLLHAAIEATNEAILITSANLEAPGPHIEYANPAFLRTTGYETHEVIGQTPRILQGPRTDRGILRRMRAALGAGEAFQGEAVNYRKDGSTYVVEWLITPVRAGDGEITHWVSAQRDISERRAAEEQQALMVRELHHRVKNTLAIVQAVHNATVRSSQTVPELTRAFSGRIASLARTHALISEDVSQTVTFEGLVQSELKPYGEGGRLRLEGPDVVLPSELAVPVSMALHELTTNALQYGSLAVPTGRLEVKWTIEGDQERRILHWTWEEHDGPPVAQPTREGFGSRLLNKILAAQTAAEVHVTFASDGLRVAINVPFPTSNK